MKGKKVRRFYGAAALVILAAEVLIALFLRDGFVRPYGGDILAALFVYCLARLLFPQRARWLPWAVFALCCGVELLQSIDAVALLGLQGSTFLSVLCGRTFDGADILCYAVGCLAAGAWQAVPEPRFIPDCK